MKHKITALFIMTFLFAVMASQSAPVSKKTGVSFDKALPEDISNENFPDRVDSFNYPNASLFDLVSAIGKFTGINFILDNELKGKKISIIAPSPITVAEAYKAFLSALAVHGYTLVKVGAFWKIQTTAKSLKDNIEVYSGDYFPNTDQLITRIIKLKHINAKDFIESIKFLLSQTDQIKAHESSNSIILSDYGSVIERIMKIVYEMDVPGAEEQIAIIPINHASAEEVASMLEQLLSDQNRKSGGSRLTKNQKGRTNVVLSINSKKSGTGQVKVSKIIADTRTNSLVISANKAGLNRVKALIKKIDTRLDPERIGGVYVYHVLHGTAEDVYNTFMGVKEGSESSPSRPSPSRRNFSNRRSTFGSKAGSSPLFGDVQIMVDNNTNSLIISAKEYEYKRVLKVLQKIDTPRDQVFIQAIILEMMINKSKERSINLAGALGANLGDTVRSLLNAVVPGDYEDQKWIDVVNGTIAGFLTDSIGVSNIANTQFGPGLLLGKSLGNMLGSIANVKDPTLDFKQSRLERLTEENNSTTLKEREELENEIRSLSQGSFDQRLASSIVPIVRLLNSIDNVNVLSTPQITTLDNVKALVEITEKVPIGLSSSLSGTGISQQNIDTGDITLKLEITPRINLKSGTIQMLINQQFDDISEKNSAPPALRSQALSTLTRKIETEMVVHDGETAVLGGLLTDRNINGKSKVPLLGDIPFLGWAFRGENTSVQKRNLLVFITPTIIRGSHNKQSHQDLVHKKLEERIRFIEKYMGARDPHAEILEELVPVSKSIRQKHIEMEESEEDFSFHFFRKKKKPLKDVETADSQSQQREADFEELLESESPQSPQGDSPGSEFGNRQELQEEFQDVLEQPLEDSTEDSTDYQEAEEESFDTEYESTQEENPDEDSTNYEEQDPQEAINTDETPALQNKGTVPTEDDSNSEEFIPLDLENLDL